MSDFWMRVIEGLITLVAGGAIGWYINLKRAPHENRKIEAEAKVDITTAANSALDLMRDAIAFAKEERGELTAKIEQLEKSQEDLKIRIDYDAEGRVLRDKRITELEQHIEQLNRDYAKAMGILQDKYNKLKAYTEKLVRALQEAKIDVPGINGDLSDSVQGLKLWDK